MDDQEGKNHVDFPLDEGNVKLPPGVEKTIQKWIRENPVKPIQLDGDLVERVSQELMHMAEMVQVPIDEVIELGKDSATNKEEYFGFLLDLYPKLDTAIEELINSSWRGPSGLESIHAPFGLVYLRKYNLALKEKERIEFESGDFKILDDTHRKTVAEVTLDKGASQEEFERELRRGARTVRSGRAMMSDGVKKL